MTQAEFHGTAEEGDALSAAMAKHCTCRVGPGGERTSVCATHRMLEEDQRALDGLLFARRMLRERMRQQEFSPAES